MKSQLLLPLLSFAVWAGWSQVSAAQAASGENRVPPGRIENLTIAQALARVMERNPELAVSDLEIQAASARVVQAGLRPNPEVLAEAENLSMPGIGPGVFRYTESTLQVSQRVELGGKRALRMRAAEKEVSVASCQQEAKKVELIAATSLAFTEALTEQQRLLNQRELSRLAQQSHSIVVERVAAGKVSPVEQTRAAVALAAAQLEQEKRARALVAAKGRLAALWGGTDQDIETVEGVFAIPAIDPRTTGSCIQDNAELKVAIAAVGARDAALALELASRKPDLTVSAGFRRLNLEDAEVWMAGVSIPVPIFDKRQGAIAEARIRLDQSRTAEQALERRLRAALAQARHDHAIALLEVKTLTESTLPGAREAAAAVEEGYRLGKFDFLNVLDAQRTYAELQGRYIEAVASGLKAAIEIQRLARCDSSTAQPARSE